MSAGLILNRDRFHARRGPQPGRQGCIPRQSARQAGRQFMKLTAGARFSGGRGAADGNAASSACRQRSQACASEEPSRRTPGRVRGPSASRGVGRIRAVGLNLLMVVRLQQVRLRAFPLLAGCYDHSFPGVESVSAVRSPGRGFVEKPPRIRRRRQRSGPAEGASGPTEPATARKSSRRTSRQRHGPVEKLRRRAVEEDGRPAKLPL